LSEYRVAMDAPSRALCCGGQNDAPQPTRLRPDVRRVAVEPSTANPSPTKRSLAGRNFVATYPTSLARLKKNSTLRWEKNYIGRIVHLHNRLVHRIIVKRLCRRMLASLRGISG